MKTIQKVRTGGGLQRVRLGHRFLRKEAKTRYANENSRNEGVIEDLWCLVRKKFEGLEERTQTIEKEAGLKP